MNEQLLSVKQLAERWSLTPHTLMAWRKKNKGPPFMRIGQKIFYKLADVELFEDNNISKPSVS